MPLYLLFSYFIENIYLYFCNYPSLQITFCGIIKIINSPGCDDYETTKTKQYYFESI